jgi:hypothetical protein
MELLRVVLFIIVAAVALLVAFTILELGTEQATPHIPKGPTQVLLVSQPQVGKLGPDFCDSATKACNIPIRVYGLRVKSNYTGDVDVVVSYKDQEWVVPCGTGASRRGPCRLTGAETSLDIELDISDVVSTATGKLDPPTLNLSSSSVFRGWVPHRQRLIIGNFEMFSRVLAESGPLGFPEIISNAVVIAECNQAGTLGRQTRLSSLGKDGSAVLPLCGGSMSLAVKKIDESNERACLDVSVAGGTAWNGAGDNVKVTFWRHSPEFRGEQDLDPCGDLPPAFVQSVEYFDKFQFFSEDAVSKQKCLDSFMGSIDLEAEVPPYNPAASTWKIETCD